MKTIYSPEYRKLVGWIAAERRYKDVSQAQLAEKVGFKNSTYISKIEKFDRKIDISEYILICEALELDAHEGLDFLIKK